MKNNYSKLIKYLRVKENIPQELLGKKLGVSKSNVSRLENSKQNLVVDDLELALKYLGCKIKIINKDGVDMMVKMNNELKIREMKLVDNGYAKDFVDKKGNTIMVEFNLLGGNIVIAKDMFDKNRYLSMKEYESYQEKYSDEEGYGEFYENYELSVKDDLWDVLGQDTIDSDNLEFNDLARLVFENSILDEIQELFIELSK